MERRSLDLLGHVGQRVPEHIHGLQPSRYVLNPPLFRIEVIQLIRVCALIAPTALSNGPTILEAQVDFIVDAIAKLEEQHAKSIEPTQSAEKEWKTMIGAMNEKTLFPLTSSWWTGGNIPGKKAESLTYIGGINMYEKTCRETLDDWKGFHVVAA